MFIAYEHMLIALIVLVLIAIFGMLWAYRSGAYLRGHIIAEKLDFARRTGTHAWIRRKGKPAIKAYIVSAEQLAALKQPEPQPTVNTFVHPDIGEERA